MAEPEDLGEIVKTLAILIMAANLQHLASAVQAAKAPTVEMAEREQPLERLILWLTASIQR
jgi:hypothetical protein